MAAESTAGAGAKSVPQAVAERIVRQAEEAEQLAREERHEQLRRSRLRRYYAERIALELIRTALICVIMLYAIRWS